MTTHNGAMCPDCTCPSGACDGHVGLCTLPAIKTAETVIGIRNEDGTVEPIVTGRTYDTRTTPLVQIRRTVWWAESVASDWEPVERTEGA